jgi:hypothetical protein
MAGGKPPAHFFGPALRVEPRRGNGPVRCTGPFVIPSRGVRVLLSFRARSARNPYG